MMNEALGQIHFVGSIICMNVIFMPMFVQGLAGVNRRLWDGGTLYTHAQGTLSLNVPMSYAALALAFFQLFFIVNLVWSIRGRPQPPATTRGRRPRSNGRRRLLHARMGISIGSRRSSEIPTSTALRARRPASFRRQRL